MTGHHDWCSPTCSAGSEGARHRGCVTPVGDDPHRPIATVWLEEYRGVVRVGFAAGLTIPAMTIEDARRFAAAVDEVAAEGLRVRV